MAVMFADPDGFRSTSMASSDQNSVVMDSSTLAAGAVYGGGGGDDPPRVKLLCSFGGSILPRPLDGKLRYVGGETRIVSMPRDVRYEELMARMRELFEGAWVVKYQQPDEDLDALVSVVNDDDVTNMMEEYDKLGAGGEGFTRLRIFLFSQPDLDERGSLASPQFDAADERETERRYVDALNSLSDGKPQSPDGAAGVDPGNRVHLNGDSFFGAQGVDVGVHGHQLNNLRCLTIPRLPSQGQLYSEMEGSWSPAAYYSPGQHTPHDARDFPPSPSTASAARFNVGMGDRFPDDYVMHSSAHQNHYEHVSPFVDSNNMVWLPPSGVVGEMSGFPGNLGHTHSGVYDGNGSCEHCRMAFQRNQVPILDARYYDPRRHHGLPHLEQASIGGGDAAAQFSSSCAECVRQRESYLLNPEMKFDHGSYASEQLDYRPFYNELHGHDRNWGLHHHQLGHHPEEMRGHRNEQYLVDGNAVNFPFMHGSLYNRNSVPLNYVGHDDPRYSRSAIEQGSDLYHDQPVGASLPPLRVPTRGDGGIRYGNTASAYGVDGMYQVPHESASDHAIRRNMQGPVGSGPSYEAPQGLMLQTNGAGSLGYQRGTPEGSPRFSRDRVDDQIQNPWSGHNVNTSQKVFPIDCPPDHYHDHATKPNLNALNQEIWHSPPPELVNCQPSRGKHGSPEEAASLVSSPAQLVDGKLAASCSPVNHQYHKDVDHTSGGTKEKEVFGETNTTKQEHAVVELDVCNGLSLYKNVDIGLDPDRPRHSEVEARPALLDETNSSSALIGETKASDHDESGEYAKERLSFLPKLIASVKKAALEGAEDVNAGTQADSDVNALLVPNKKDLEVNENPELEQNVPKDLDANSDGERPIIPKIEPTTAEMEALAKGLQAIKNDDLEEIRELGSGAYGSVFHGKWKGSDVAIKRIKASCFSGRPSERERLISDFWKEALILSSLHHPNVVAFYGVVRDGPDGTLATVTEFMINGSLKQFLQKKDRTIDRRKRLIIAMDAAFGMEYLHGKNIVHFDLKCENLLVNMRDPQRPVCKIGDLGLSKVRHKTLVSGGIRGTLPWMAPELLSGKSKMVSEKIDVYSFGVVMWELLTGEDPYADMHCASIIGGIVNNTLRPQIPSWCDPEWRSLMESCWASDPADRPSFSEISQKLRKMAAAINVK